LKPERTVAVDASAKMLGLLRGKELDGVDIQHETVQRFVEATGDRFDLITFMSAAEFLPNLPVTLHRTARLLNKNGTMLFTYLPLDEGQRPEELIDDTEKLGASAVVHSWPAQEIEWSVTDSGLEVLEHARLADIQPVDTLDYNFMIARKLHAGN
jgi:predicted TPR repeat methyltransferase